MQNFGGQIRCIKIMGDVQVDNTDTGLRDISTYKTPCKSRKETTTRPAVFVTGYSAILHMFGQIIVSPSSQR